MLAIQFIIINVFYFL